MSFMMYKYIKQKSFKVTDVSQGRHISHVTSDRVWISDGKNLILTNTVGKELDRRSDQFSGYGVHTVNNNGDLIYIDDAYIINKVSKDKLKTPFIDNNTEPCAPQCVYSSPSTGDLLVGMINGKVMRYSSKGQNIQTSQRLYTSPIYITENRNGDVIVSDKVHAVVVTDHLGNHRFSYTGHPPGTELRPFGICTDELSHILVCDTYTKSVQMLDMNGKFLMQTSPNGTYTPQGISYDDKTHTVWEGSHYSNTVTIYRLLDGDSLTVNLSNHQKQRSKVKIDESSKQNSIPEKPAGLSDEMKKLDIKKKGYQKNTTSKAIDKELESDKRVPRENLDTESDSLKRDKAVVFLEKEVETVENRQNVSENSEISGILLVSKDVSDDHEKTITMTDFAGQCAYYASHQSPQAFFIPVLNMKKKFDEQVGDEVCFQKGSLYERWTQRDCLEFWMKSNHQYSNDKAPVLIIGTHSKGKTEEVHGDEAETEAKGLYKGSLPGSSGPNNLAKIPKLLQVGTDAVRICFDKFFPKETLEKTLKENESDLRRGQFRFQPPQLEILFPKQGGPNTDVSSLSMDITIMYKLLRNFSDIAPPGNGWGKEPKIIDIAESDDIERIRLYRNKYNHDSGSNPVISDGVFNIIWNDLSKAILRLSGGVLKRRISEI